MMKLLDVLAELPGAVHALSHVTGGGIAANLARVLPVGSWAELDRGSWSPPTVFRVLCELSGDSLESTEGTWNLGVGMLAVVAHDSASSVIRARETAVRPVSDPEKKAERTSRNRIAPIVNQRSRLIAV